MDVSNPLSTFRKQTSHRKHYIMPSRFVRDEWLSFRGMDDKEKLAKQQKMVGAITHLKLQAMESYSLLYNKVNDMVLWSIGQPNTVNMEWSGGTTQSTAISSMMNGRTDILSTSKISRGRSKWTLLNH